jgi:hypothetical protein
MFEASGARSRRRFCLFECDSGLSLITRLALVVQSGMKDEAPSFAKNTTRGDTATIVAYLHTQR